MRTLQTIDVIIPVYKPDDRLQKILRALDEQTVRPAGIILMFTCGDGETLALPELGCPVRVERLTKEEFDHGGTRNRGAAFSGADLMLFMTQDAVPADEFLTERLRASLNANEQAAVAYARQLPNPDCRYIERYTRSFNYPEESAVKSSRDVERLGIKTYFCSDVCAMYVRETFRMLGGFIPEAIFNEDMIFAAGAVRAGYEICYAADAAVYHSHNYSGREQFKRNFDLAVSQEQHPEVFRQLSSEREGVALVKDTAAYLLKNGRWYLLPQLVYMSGMKYLGYRFGRKYERLSRKTVLRMTMNPNYWRKYYGTDQSNTL